jgi:predicted transcriptional regulator
MTAATTPELGIKQAALDIVQSLPDNATWGDLQYKLHVREKIERGLADIEAGRVVSHETVMAEFGLKP